MTRKFKKGDIVICVIKDRGSLITNGKRYKIRQDFKQSLGWARIEADDTGNPNGFYPEHFILDKKVNKFNKQISDVLNSDLSKGKQMKRITYKQVGDTHVNNRPIVWAGNEYSVSIEANHSFTINSTNTSTNESTVVFQGDANDLAHAKKTVRTLLLSIGVFSTVAVAA
jgi:hypothetical protein